MQQTYFEVENFQRQRVRVCVDDVNGGPGYVYFHISAGGFSVCHAFGIGQAKALGAAMIAAAEAASGEQWPADEVPA